MSVMSATCVLSENTPEIAQRLDVPEFRRLDAIHECRVFGENPGTTLAHRMAGPLDRP
jgi:hypothetical protein